MGGIKGEIRDEFKKLGKSFQVPEGEKKHFVSRSGGVEIYYNPEHKESRELFEKTIEKINDFTPIHKETLQEMEEFSGGSSLLTLQQKARKSLVDRVLQGDKDGADAFVELMKDGIEQSTRKEIAREFVASLEPRAVSGDNTSPVFVVGADSKRVPVDQLLIGNEESINKFVELMSDDVPESDRVSNARRIIDVIMPQTQVDVEQENTRYRDMVARQSAGVREV